MAFNRIITVKVGPAPTEGKTYADGVLISELDLSFEIVRSVTLSDNKCDLSIYNATEDTINKMLKAGNNIRIEAGYEDEGSGVLYVGNILESFVTYDGLNRVVNLKAGGIQKSQEALEYLTTSLSYSANSNLALPLKDVSSALGLSPFGVEQGASITMPNGFSYTGSVKGALYQLNKILKSNGYGLFIDNDIMVVYKLNFKDTKFKFAYLTHESGLINAFYKTHEYKKGDDKEYLPRVEYKCLLNPNLVPNGLVTIKGKAVDGTFINEKVTFKGDNFGGEFTTSGVAIV